MEPDAVRVRYGAGRGGADFHSPGPPLHGARGGYFWGDPRPAPVRGESPLIPCTGPRFSPPILTGIPSGEWAGRGGAGARNPKKTRPSPEAP